MPSFFEKFNGRLLGVVGSLSLLQSVLASQGDVSHGGAPDDGEEDMINVHWTWYLVAGAAILSAVGGVSAAFCLRHFYRRCCGSASAAGDVREVGPAANQV